MRKVCNLFQSSLAPNYDKNKIWRFCYKKQYRLTSGRTPCSIMKMRLLLRPKRLYIYWSSCLRNDLFFPIEVHSFAHCSGLFCDAVGRLNTILSRTVWWLLNNELERMQKEGLIPSTLIQHHPVRTKKNHATSTSRWPVTGSKLLNPGLQG